MEKGHLNRYASVSFNLAWLPAVLAAGCLIPPPQNAYYRKQAENPSTYVARVESTENPARLPPRRPETVAALSHAEIARSTGQDRWRALLVGISDYSQATGLRDLGLGSLDAIPVNDVRSIATVLRQDYGFAEITILLDRQATRRGIITALQNLHDGGPSDNILIYFAGHGHLRKDDVGVWLPCDAQALADGITSAEIKETLKNLPAKRVLLLSDSCFAGAFLTRGLAVQAKSSRVVEASTSEKISRQLVLNQRPCREVITSGNLAPVPNEGEGAFRGNSPFAGALLSALRSVQPGGVVSTDDLFVDVYYSLRQNARPATPERVLPKQSTLPGHYGGEFFLIRKP
jgi:hypothetical protein